MAITQNHNLPDGGTLVWSGAMSVEILRFDGTNYVPTNIVANGTNGNLELPPGNYQIALTGNECDEQCVLEVFPTTAAVDPAVFTDLIDAINSMKAMQVEFDTLPIGCTKDANGDVNGRVFHRTDVSENDNTETQSLFWVGVGAAAAVPYDAAVHGDWEDCSASDLEISNFADLVALLEASTDLQVTIDPTQIQELIDAINADDDTDDDIDYSYTVVESHCLDDEPVYTLIRSNNKVDPDGVSVDETVAAGYVSGGAFSTTLPAGAVVGRCSAKQKVAVYTCDYTMTESMDARFWNDPDTTTDGTGSAVDIFALVGADLHDMNLAWTAGVGAAAHVNGTPDDTLLCTLGDTVRNVDAPSYDSGITGSSPESNQISYQGWVAVPEGVTEWLPGIQQRGNAQYGFYAGASPLLTTQQFWDVRAAGTLAITGPAPLDLTDGTYQTVPGIGTMVYVKAYVSNGIGFGGLFLREVIDGTAQVIPTSRLTCTFPELTQTVRFEDTPYTLQDGESFSKCEEPEVVEAACVTTGEVQNLVGDSGPFVGMPVVGCDGIIDDYIVISGTGPTDLNSVIPAERVQVYICGWTHQEGWHTRWWYGDDAAPVVRINPVEAGMDSQQCDVSQSFNIVGSDVTHANSPTEEVCGFYFANGIYRDNAAAGYDAAIHNALPSQGIQQGWVRIHVDEASVRVGLQVAGGSSSNFYAGYTPQTLSLVAENISAPTAFVQSQDYAIDLNRGDATFTLGAYWYVYLRTVTADPTATSAVRLQMQRESEVSYAPIAVEDISCSFPTPSGASSRFENSGYVLAAGESFAPCEVPDTSTITVNGVDFESCSASDDGRPLLINTATGDLTEIDGSPVPVGVMCATSVDPDAIATDYDVWVVRLDGNNTGESLATLEASGFAPADIGNTFTIGGASLFPEYVSYTTQWLGASEQDAELDWNGLPYLAGFGPGSAGYQHASLPQLTEGSSSERHDDEIVLTAAAGAVIEFRFKVEA